MVYSEVFVMSVVLTSAVAIPMCTSQDGLNGVERKKMLPNSQIANLTTPGIMTCSRACLYSRKCQSFNFNVDTGECQLNSRTAGPNTTVLLIHTNYLFSDISQWPEKLAGVCAHHTCPRNSICDPVNKTTHVCKVSFCLDIPTVENGHFSKNSDASLLGTILPLVCDLGFMPQGEVICQDNGTWSSPVCSGVSSCSMVQQYQPDCEDSEYWLRLTNFDNYTTRIYCHNMATSSPREFLTLPNVNYGIYPQIMNMNCTGETELGNACTDKGGEIWFSKIRVNITNMQVFRPDKTFANISHSKENLKYGQAFDCYTEDPDNCGKDIKGKFTLDLRGTGWRVGDDQVWVPFSGGNKMKVDRNLNGTLIFLQCGGFDGGCRPKGKNLYLTPHPEGKGNYDP